MTEMRRCPSCGTELPPGTPEGLCPACLLRAGLASSQGSEAVAPREVTAAYVPGLSAPAVEHLARYFPQLEILEFLGKGGMGAVYKARQPHLDRLVAVKILPPEVSGDPAFAERFSREARALARLNHPNIVGVHDFGLAAHPSSVTKEAAPPADFPPEGPTRQAGPTAGLYYLVMEYVDGVNLRQALQAGKLSPAEALKIVPQICDALQFAHDEGIVHRDIKPENILLDKKGRVKIADFGLAKLLGKAPDATSLTGTQQVMGTLHYMAPEQVEGARDVDHRADIYSLGVTFYEMLTGELPLGRFAPPSKKVHIDVRLDEVVLRALEKEPGLRYQHASELKTEVEAVAREAVGKRPHGARTPQAVSQLRWMLLAVVALAFVLVGWVLFQGRLTEPSFQAPVRDPEQLPTKKQPAIGADLDQPQAEAGPPWGVFLSGGVLLGLLLLVSFLLARQNRRELDARSAPHGQPEGNPRRQLAVPGIGLFWPEIRFRLLTLAAVLGLHTSAFFQTAFRHSVQTSGGAGDQVVEGPRPGVVIARSAISADRFWTGSECFQAAWDHNELCWYANPAVWAGCLLLAGGVWRWAMTLGILGAMLAVSVQFQFPISVFHRGYWWWLGSTILLAGSGAYGWWRFAGPGLPRLAGRVSYPRSGDAASEVRLEDDPRRQLVVPGIGLFLAVVLDVFGITFLTVIPFLEDPARPVFGSWSPNWLIYLVLAGQAWVCFAFFSEALAMLHPGDEAPGGFYLIMIMIMPPGLILGLPFGLWALVVLGRPEVKAAFEREAKRTRDKQAATDVKDTPEKGAGPEGPEQWWLRQTMEIRRTIKALLWMLLLGGLILFSGFSQHGEVAKNGPIEELKTITEVGIPEPWLTIERTEGMSKRWSQSVHWLTWSMAAGVLSLFVIQILWAIRRLEKKHAQAEAPSELGPSGAGSPSGVVATRRLGNWLFALGILILVVWIPFLAVTGIMAWNTRPDDPQVREIMEVLVPVSVSQTIFALLLGPVILLGAQPARSRQDLFAARRACGLALIPFSVMWPLGFCVGLWGLMVLRRPEVVAEFNKNQRTERLATAEPEAPGWAFVIGWVSGRLVHGLGSRLLIIPLCLLGAGMIFQTWIFIEIFGNVQHAGGHPPLGAWAAFDVWGHELWQTWLICTLFFALACFAVATYNLRTARWPGVVLLLGGLTTAGLSAGVMGKGPLPEASQLRAAVRHLQLAAPNLPVAGRSDVQILEEARRNREIIIQHQVKGGAYGGLILGAALAILAAVEVQRAGGRRTAFMLST